MFYIEDDNGLYFALDSNDKVSWVSDLASATFYNTSGGAIKDGMYFEVDGVVQKVGE
ncbi:coil containing protein [Vibrio phage 1.121.O._10N.286.46.C4]|nr:coil containing protein [Vibrio phage 1.121.O._10N.286.46.C4]